MYEITQGIQTKGDFGLTSTNPDEITDIIGKVLPVIDLRPAYNTFTGNDAVRGISGKAIIYGNDGRTQIFEAEITGMMNGTRIRFSSMHPDGISIDSRIKSMFPEITD